MRVEWNTEEESTNVITLRGLGLPTLSPGFDLQNLASHNFMLSVLILALLVPQLFTPCSFPPHPPFLQELRLNIVVCLAHLCNRELSKEGAQSNKQHHFENWEYTEHSTVTWHFNAANLCTFFHTVSALPTESTNLWQVIEERCNKK